MVLHSHLLVDGAQWLLARRKILFGLAATAFVYTGAPLSLLLTPSQPALQIYNSMRPTPVLGVVQDVDITERTMSIDWSIVHSQNLTIEMYFDGSSLPSTTKCRPVRLLSNNSTSSSHTSDVSCYSNKHLLQWLPGSRSAETFVYPFDAYYVTTYVRAALEGRNTSIPLSSLQLVDATDRFIPEIKFEDDILVNSGGQGYESWRMTEIQFTRTATSRVIVMSVFATSWLLTLGVLVWTVRAHLGAAGRFAHTSVLYPTAVILLLGELRDMWIGAPARVVLLDYCGTYPQTIAMLLSIFAIAFTSWVQGSKTYTTTRHLPGDEVDRRSLSIQRR